MISSEITALEGCDLQSSPVAVIIQGNTNLTSIDLSSLQEVCGGSVVVFNNPQLCYIGEFNHYLKNSSQVTCLGSEYARDLDQCGNFPIH